MEKICFNNKNELIGIDLNDSINFINLFDININKKIKQYKNENAKDSLGRQLYKIIDKNTNEYTISNQIINNNELQTEKYIYQVPIKTEISLLNNIDQFTIDDIINEKKNQLQQIYDFNDCILYELLNEEDITFNTDMGKNIIKVYKDKEIISNQLKINNAEQVAIYYESDDDLQIEISANKRIWKSINKGEYINFNNKNMYIKFLSPNDTNIYSVAILIK